METFFLGKLGRAGCPPASSVWQECWSQCSGAGVCAQVWQFDTQLSSHWQDYQEGGPAGTAGPGRDQVWAGKEVACWVKARLGGGCQWPAELQMCSCQQSLPQVYPVRCSGRPLLCKDKSSEDAGRLTPVTCDPVGMLYTARPLVLS